VQGSPVFCGFPVIFVGAALQVDLVSVNTPLVEGIPAGEASPAALPLMPNTEPGGLIHPLEEKNAIRRSLAASSLDGLFATIYGQITSGVLLSNFLLALQAGPMAIGMIVSVPMLANLVQPLGAYWSNRTTSRRNFGSWVNVPARLLWLVLALGIGAASWGHWPGTQLTFLCLGVVIVSSFLGGLGTASWLSWLASLVPRQLRGRYFGLRSSIASLTALLTVPLAGVVVARWPGGPVQGYGLLLLVAVAAGLISLGFQRWMVDVNPQDQVQLLRQQQRQQPRLGQQHDLAMAAIPAWFWQDRNFLIFLAYLAVWSFSVNLSNPFFNLYLLEDLQLDITVVTLYTSLSAAANLSMLVLWGRVADRLGNRVLLLGVGGVVAITPLLWLGTGANGLSIWLWLPLLHLLGGGTWAAIELCLNNLQIGIAPVPNQSGYFATAAAVAGVCGALGGVAGGYTAATAGYTGPLGLFVLSSLLRLVALMPLVFVDEGRSIRQLLQVWFPGRPFTEV
jgi:MFS family permease